MKVDIAMSDSIDIRKYIQNNFVNNGEYIAAMLSRNLCDSMPQEEKTNVMIINAINASLELSVLSTLDILQELQVIPSDSVHNTIHVDKPHLRLVWDSDHPEKAD